MPTAMTREEREVFLSAPHVAVLSIPDGGRGPLAIPIWYQYEPEENLIWMTTGGLSRKGRLLAQTARVSLQPVHA
jgi:nitroimidazol reductase NimA-like FMN-containing flavoprotein (pyridoxamine 5'-phosphate oxidase superfamily)